MLFLKNPIHNIQFRFFLVCNSNFLKLFMYLYCFLFFRIFLFIKWCVHELALNSSTFICKGFFKGFHNHFLKYQFCLYVYNWVISCCVTVKVVHKQKVVYRTNMICWNFFLWSRNRGRRNLFVLHMLLSIPHNWK